MPNRPKVEANPLKEALGSKRELPQDSGEFDKAIRFPKMFAANTIIPGLNAINKIAKVQEFSEEEKDGGALAFGAYIWENWEKFDAKLLIMMWLIGVTPVRVAEFMANKEKEKKHLKDTNPTKLHAPTAIQQTG